MLFNRVHFKQSKKAEDEDTDPSLLTKHVILKENRRLSNDYIVGEFLGSGKFGEVKRCEEKQTGGKFAAKFVPIACDADWESVQNEIAIMNRLRHPRLIQLYDAYSRKSEVVMVLELITGGELFERIIDESFDLNESRCIRFMNEILQGVEYIHNQGVLHLDLKPENILCLSRTSFKIKIIDFGLARFYDGKEMCVLFGTPEFVSPEVISYEPVCPAADMWSVGVICYVMLSGLSPFMGDSQGETLANIMRVTYDFNYPEFAEISEEARDFIRKLLVKDPKKRMTATECLDHPWIKKKRQLKRKGTVSKKRLKHFVYRRKWQKAVNAIIALQRMGVVLRHPYSPQGDIAEQTMPNSSTTLGKTTVPSSSKQAEFQAFQSPKSRHRRRSFKSLNQSLFGRLTTKRLANAEAMASEDSSSSPASQSSSNPSRRPSIMSKFNWNSASKNPSSLASNVKDSSTDKSDLLKSTEKQHKKKSQESDSKEVKATIHKENQSIKSVSTMNNSSAANKSDVSEKLPKSSCIKSSTKQENQLTAVAKQATQTTSLKLQEHKHASTEKSKIGYNGHDSGAESKLDKSKEDGKKSESTSDKLNSSCKHTNLTNSSYSSDAKDSASTPASKGELKRTSAKPDLQKPASRRVLPQGTSIASRIGFFSNLNANRDTKPHTHH